MEALCTLCKGEQKVLEINVEEIAKKLKPMNSVPKYCEGCGIVAIGKDKHNNTTVAYKSSKGFLKYVIYGSQEYYNRKELFLQGKEK